MLEYETIDQLISIQLSRIGDIDLEIESALRAYDDFQVNKPFDTRIIPDSRRDQGSTVYSFRSTHNCAVSRCLPSLFVSIYSPDVNIDLTAARKQELNSVQAELELSRLAAYPVDQNNYLVITREIAIGCSIDQNTLLRSIEDLISEYSTLVLPRFL